jgi:hypothetical protein
MAIRVIWSGTASAMQDLVMGANMRGDISFKRGGRHQRDSESGRCTSDPTSPWKKCEQPSGPTHTSDVVHEPVRKSEGGNLQTASTPRSTGTIQDHRHMSEGKSDDDSGSKIGPGADIGEAHK